VNTEGTDRHQRERRPGAGGDSRAGAKPLATSKTRQGRKAGSILARAPNFVGGAPCVGYSDLLRCINGGAKIKTPNLA